MALVVGGGDVSDITNSPAYTHLDALVAAGELREAQASLYKAKYAKLHDVVLRTYDHEKNLLRRAKQLNQELLAEKMKLDKATTRAQEDSDAIAALRDELGKGGIELTNREEKETALQLEADALGRQKADLERDAAAREKLQAEMLQPQIDALERAVDEAASELARQQASLLRLQTERKGLHDRIAESRTARNAAEAEKGAHNATFVKVRTEPDKLKKQADVVAGTAGTLEGDVAKLAATIAALDAEAALQARRRKELDEQRTEYAVAAERARHLTEAKERECDQLAKRLELARGDTSSSEVDRVRLELEQKGLAMELKREEDGLNRRVKDYNAALKRMRKAEVAMQQAQQLVPHEKLQAHELERQIATKRSLKARQLAAIEEARREVDIFINNYLKQEDSEAEQLLWLQQLRAEVSEYQAELGALQENDRAMHARIAQLNAQREVTRPPPLPPAGRAVGAWRAEERRPVRERLARPRNRGSWLTCAISAGLVPASRGPSASPLGRRCAGQGAPGGQSAAADARRARGAQGARARADRPEQARPAGARAARRLWQAVRAGEERPQQVRAADPSERAGPRRGQGED